MNPGIVRELYFEMPRENTHRLYIRRRPILRRRAVRRDELAVARCSFVILWRARLAPPEGELR